MSNNNDRLEVAKNLFEAVLKLRYDLIDTGNLNRSFKSIASTAMATGLSKERVRDISSTN